MSWPSLSDAFQGLSHPGDSVLRRAHQRPELHLPQVRGAGRAAHERARLPPQQRLAELPQQQCHCPPLRGCPRESPSPRGGGFLPDLCAWETGLGAKKGENIRSRRWSLPEVSQWKERGDVMGGITRKLETSLSGLQQNRCRYQLKIKKNIPTLKWKKFHFYSTQKLKNRPLPLFSTVV